MANITVSAAIDNLLRSSDTSASRNAIGLNGRESVIFAYFVANEVTAGFLRIGEIKNGALTNISQTSYGAGPTGSLRDPSIIFYRGEYYIAYTCELGNPASNRRFAIAKSPDLETWTHVTYVDCSTLTVSPNNVWAPEFFIDSDGTVCIYVSINTGATGSYGKFSTALYTATNAALTTWNSGQIIIGESYIDCFMWLENGTYYAFVKNETTYYIEVFTSTSRNGTFTKVVSGDALGFGTDYEGPCLYKDSHTGTYILYLDHYVGSLGTYYSTSTSLLSGWSAPVAVTGAGSARHASIIPMVENVPRVVPVRSSTSKSLLNELNNAAILNTVSTANNFLTPIAAFGTGNLTISGFVYVPTIRGASGGDIQIIGGATNALLPTLRRVGDYNFRLNLAIDGIYGSTTSPERILLDQWTHVAITRASGVVTYYVNGAISGSYTQTLNATVANTTQGYFGQGCLFARFFASTTALLPAQILKIYNDNGIVTPGITCAWAMSDAGKYSQADGVPDKSGNSKTITLTAGNYIYNPK